MSSGPTFLGIGAPKCGTTWLHTELGHHPDVWLPPKKELHYFDRAHKYESPTELADDTAWKRLVSPAGWRKHQVLYRIGKIGQAMLQGRRDDAHFWKNMVFGRYDDRWYRTLFPSPDRYNATGEITPAYCMLLAEDVHKLQAINPDMRIIFLMRDPVERAWSSLRYNAGRDMIDVDLSNLNAVLDMIEEGDGDVHGGRGDYLRTLEVFGEVFDPSQILVGFYDAISSNPEELLTAVTDHLGVAPVDHAVSTSRVNASKPRDMPPEVRGALFEKYRGQIDGVIARVGGRSKSWANDTEYAGPVAQPLG